MQLRRETTVGELLARLAGEADGHLRAVSHKALDDAAGHIVVVNGANIRSLRGLHTPIDDGDVVSVLPVVVGG